MATLEASVRDLISLYVGGYFSADALNDALPDTSVIDEADEPEATELAMLVIGYLAEYQSGDRLEVSLREALQDHASWSSTSDQTSGVTLRDGLEIRVRAAARTPLQVAPA